ncbi:hypothetical protein like AT3G48675 [Hibiscus trionum]|uniref:Prolamin-like domain-containing protein n=1 Tax=Hibiscus trionum TaxID=183268 RepID=A0A9W7M8B2_HIBTR|nr:hypothetical protein like AT3G48675 [Hibiscus trionum]
MSMSSQTTIWLLVATFTALLVQPGLADLVRLLPPIPLGIIPHFPGQPLPPPERAPTALECFSTLLNVPGCVGDIYESMCIGQFDSIGNNCCKAFSAISVNCWPIMFNVGPSFPTLLKEYCARSGAAPPKSK